MLVLSRKKGEQINIGDGITITVVEVQGQRIKLGIQAPDSYRILRAELPREEPTSPNEMEGRRKKTPAGRTSAAQRRLLEQAAARRQTGPVFPNVELTPVTAARVTLPK